MKNNHWNKYYNLHDKPFEKSDFAVFSLDYIEKGQRLIDIGCGNGRDSVFFKEHGLTTLGIDYSSVAIQNLSKYESKNLKFKQLDVSKITKVLKNEYFDVCYCRFFIHSIKEENEEILFDWIDTNVEKLLLIETRVVDKNYESSNQDHYRRPSDPKVLINKIQSIGFKLEFEKVSNNFSIYKDNYGNLDIKKSPELLRIVARK